MRPKQQSLMYGKCGETYTYLTNPYRGIDCGSDVFCNDAFEPGLHNLDFGKSFWAYHYDPCWSSRGYFLIAKSWDLVFMIDPSELSHKYSQGRFSGVLKLFLHKPIFEHSRKTSLRVRSFIILSFQVASTQAQFLNALSIYPDRSPITRLGMESER